MTRIAAGAGRALLLGPLAVRPAFKNLGIGRRLVAIALEAADKAGAPAVMLVGDEPYYGPLGFKQDPARADLDAAPGRSRPAPVASSSRPAPLRGLPAKSAMRTWPRRQPTPDLRPSGRLRSIGKNTVEDAAMNPHGQIAIVTGGGSGLGEATARALAAKGAKVAILDVGIGPAREGRGRHWRHCRQMRRGERRQQAEAAIAEVAQRAWRSRASWSIAPASPSP